MTIKTDLAKQVMKTIFEDKRTEDVAIEAIDNNGVVTLTGTVPSEKVRETVVEIAQNVDGVRSVISNITVKDDEKSCDYRSSGWRSVSQSYGLSFDFDLTFDRSQKRSADFGGPF